MMKMNKVLLAVASVGLLATAGSAFALGVSPASSQQVNLTVGSACTVAAPAAVTFAAIPAGGASTLQTVPTAGAVITCPLASTLYIDGGLNAVANPRNMTDGAGNFIPYTLNSGGIDIGTTGNTTAIPLGYAAAGWAVAAPVLPATTSTVAITFTLPVVTPAVAGAYTDTLKYYVEF